jgi:curved DNA-binding protein CbpA
VTAATDWDAIRTAHRKLSAKWHPDRYRTDAERSKAEAKFKELQRAFDLLSKERERAAA